MTKKEPCPSCDRGLWHPGHVCYTYADRRGVMTLTEFLLARIAEDEAFWRREPNDLATGGLAERGLAECKAKRAIVAEHEIAPARLTTYAYVVIDGKRQPAWVGGGCCRCHEGEGGSAATGEPYYCDTLCYMGEVYADHPDYRKEWKP